MSSNKIAVHRGSGNVFADLGFDNPEEMQLRADLVHELREIIKRRRLTQVLLAVVSAQAIREFSPKAGSS